MGKSVIHCISKAFNWNCLFLGLAMRRRLESCTQNQGHYAKCWNWNPFRFNSLFLPIGILFTRKIDIQNALACCHSNDTRQSLPRWIEKSTRLDWMHFPDISRTAICGMRWMGNCCGPSDQRLIISSLTNGIISADSVSTRPNPVMSCHWMRLCVDFAYSKKPVKRKTVFTVFYWPIIICLWIKTGMEKINFSVGEPFIYQKGEYLGQLVRFCKRQLKLESVTVISNGS